MKLGDLCSFERGLTYSKGDEADLSTKGVLRSNNVDLASNTLNFGEIKYLKEDIDIPVSKKVKRNSLLMCMSNGSKAHLGKVAIIEDDLDYAFGGFMGLLIPNEEIVFPRYFYYALITPMYKLYIKGLSDGANINNLKFADLKEFDIPVPPLSEQHRIVSLLDAEFAKIDALKANAEKNLQNAKDLFQAALKKELEPKEGWEWSYLPSISENLDSKRIPITQKDRIAGVYPYYGASGIVDYVSEYLFDDDLLLISEDGANLLARSTPIAFSVSGKVWVNNHAHILKFKDMATQKIVEYYFASIFIDEYITGAAQPKLTQANMNKIAIPLPPTLTDQQSIVSRLDTLNEKCKALQANYEKTLSLCDDLKQALLTKAFNGEL